MFMNPKVFCQTVGQKPSNLGLSAKKENRANSRYQVGQFCNFDCLFQYLFDSFFCFCFTSKAWLTPRVFLWWIMQTAWNRCYEGYQHLFESLEVIRRASWTKINNGAQPWKWFHFRFTRSVKAQGLIYCLLSSSRIITCAPALYYGTFVNFTYFLTLSTIIDKKIRSTQVWRKIWSPSH